MRLTKEDIKKLAGTTQGRTLLKRIGVDYAAITKDKSGGNKYRNKFVHVVLKPDSPQGHIVVPDMEKLVAYRKLGYEAFRLDSELEYQHWCRFTMMRQAGELAHYERQRTFILQDKFVHPQTGRVQRAITYVADHYFVFKDGTRGVCDTKGRRTREYVNKAKNFILKYGKDTPLYEWTTKGMVLADFGQQKVLKSKRKAKVPPTPRRGSSSS